MRQIICPLHDLVHSRSILANTRPIPQRHNPKDVSHTLESIENRTRDTHPAPIRASRKIALVQSEQTERQQEHSLPRFPLFAVSQTVGPANRNRHRPAAHDVLKFAGIRPALRLVPLRAMRADRAADVFVVFSRQCVHGNHLSKTSIACRQTFLAKAASTGVTPRSIPAPSHRGQGLFHKDPKYFCVTRPPPSQPKQNPIRTGWCCASVLGLAKCRGIISCLSTPHG